MTPAPGKDRDFEAEVVQPLRGLAGRTIDRPAILRGLLLSGSIGNRVAASYRRNLFGRMTLQDLPERPRFVFNATNLQSGALMRMSKRFAWDWRVGEVRAPTIELAVAVAASAAFPPLLSPLVLRFEASDFVPGSGDDLEEAAYRERVVLSDGGVYDNLGLETVWKNLETVLISDGGGKMGAKRRPRHVWPLQLYRVLGVIDNQVRSLRKRQSIDGFKAGLRRGTYWGIRGHIADYRLGDPLPFLEDEARRLADVKTRLARMDEAMQESLVNWGYAICDTAMRRHVVSELPRPRGPLIPNLPPARLFRAADARLGGQSLSARRQPARRRARRDRWTEDVCISSGRSSSAQ